MHPHLDPVDHLIIALLCVIVFLGFMWAHLPEDE